MAKLKSTIEKYIPNIVEEPTHKSIDYKMYWLNKPHCKESVRIIEVGGILAYKCIHEVN